MKRRSNHPKNRARRSALATPRPPVPSQYELRRYVGHTEGVMCICVSPDAKRILSGGNDRTVRLWDTQSGAELQCFQGHTENVCSVAFLRDGKRLVSGSADGTVRIWDAATGQQLKNLTGHTDAVLDGVAVLPDGKHILSGSHRRNLENLGHRERKRGSQDRVEPAIEGLAVSPDGQRAFCSCREGDIQLWDLEKRRLVHRLRGYRCHTKGAAISPDGRRRTFCRGRLRNGLSLGPPGRPRTPPL